VVYVSSVVGVFIHLTRYLYLSRAPARAHPTPPPDRSRNRDDARPWIEKGTEALAAGRFGEARSSFERAIAMDRGAHAAFAGLAEAAHNRSEFADGVLAARRAIALAPRSAPYRMLLARAYYKIMRYDEAIQEWRKALELDPENASARANIEMAKAKRER
jgi:tetratricopeptide (TPR) repeat protein